MLWSHAPAGEEQEQPRRAAAGIQDHAGSPKQVGFGENVGEAVWTRGQRRASRESHNPTMYLEVLDPYLASKDAS